MNKPECRANKDAGGPTCEASDLRFGAVAYLNMLPFFTGQSQFELLPSPSALNSEAHRFDVYCSSFIAGLNHGKMPITSHYGVFSSGAVMSVFVEPLFHTENHQTFWAQLQELWSHRHPSPISGLNGSENHGKVILRTSGDSAQSVWMFEVLCALAGFQVVALKDDVKAPLNNAGKPYPEARLYIGDKALWRIKNSPNVTRLDLGEFWTRHTGRKAWFAAWFKGNKSSTCAKYKLENILNRQLNLWQSSSEFSRWCRCFAFLENQALPHPVLNNFSDTADVRELLVDYFANLEHRITDEEGSELLNFYVNLNCALEQWKGALRDIQVVSPLPGPQLKSQPNAIHLART